MTASSARILASPRRRHASSAKSSDQVRELLARFAYARTKERSRPEVGDLRDAKTAGTRPSRWSFWFRRVLSTELDSCMTARIRYASSNRIHADGACGESSELKRVVCLDLSGRELQGLSRIRSIFFQHRSSSDNLRIALEDKSIFDCLVQQ